MENPVKIKSWYFITFLIALILFIVYELQYIDRPFYWDEAWSYASGVKAMYDKGPSLLPGAIHEYLYRGHPTFFYFITAIWLKIFGTSLTSAHSFFLLISVALILSIFFIGKDLVNELTGLIASVCLMVTPLFLAQAGFLLPEVMLALFSLLTIYFYHKNKPGLEVLSGTLLVYTKETGLVLIGTIILFDFVVRIKNTPSVKTFFSDIHKFLIHFLPILLVSLFFILQKIKLGWFFYPEHIGMMDFDTGAFRYKLMLVLKYVLKQDGRFIISLGILALLLVYFYQEGINGKIQKFISLSFLFLLNYILFSAFNFFTLRYLLSVLPILYLICSILLFKVIKDKKYFALIFVSGFSYFSLQETIHPTETGDSKPGFIQMVRVHKQAINFCEKYGYYNKEIGTHFLMLYNLKDPFLGYLEGGQTFKKAQIYNEKPTDLVVVSSIELNEHLKKVQTDTTNYRLLKRFSNNLAWCEIYEKKVKGTIKY